MKFVFYFCIPVSFGVISHEPFILTSYDTVKRFMARGDILIFRCSINGLDTYVKEL